MVKVLYFARLRDQLDCAEEQVTLQDSRNSVAELRQQLAARGEPWLSAMQDENLLVAVNQVIATPDVMVNAGDEVGFFPPVTGG